MGLFISNFRGGLPSEFHRLNAQARAEGYNFLDRLANRWRCGAYDGDAEADVLGVSDEAALLAIGAQTYDEYDPQPEHRRIRHFYVLPETRRRGVGRELAKALTERAFALAPRLHLRATHERSIAFWDAMGFARVSRPDRSHEKMRP